jgi:hypothetical protein
MFLGQSGMSTMFKNEIACALSEWKCFIYEYRTVICIRWPHGGRQMFVSWACQGRSVVQEVSRWLSTSATRVRSHVRSCGVCGRQSGTRKGFLRALRVLMLILIRPNAPYPLIIREVRLSPRQSQMWGPHPTPTAISIYLINNYKISRF